MRHMTNSSFTSINVQNSHYLWILLNRFVRDSPRRLYNIRTKQPPELPLDSGYEYLHTRSARRHQTDRQGP
jgi:hypothetical protein